ncbi:DegT/DnrJ/EryC1/StrS family aminotransferase [Bdellovibrio bacteriovorus]|uniref:DegT/DnrJ/EryC1/StrS family aminotransferase n=1 Tax=Bdellovibrio bacteriovorus TaxID=959 RepID=UPI003AA849F6
MEFIDLKSQQKRIQKQIQERINTVLTNGQYIMGPEVFELEERLAKYTGSKHCISNANGTDALMLALMAIGIKPGDEVITTPFSFFATSEVISFFGAVPVFVDIDRETYNIDASRIEEKITKKTKAIIPVSLYGQCADYDAIEAIAAKHGIVTIEDAAQSFGATYKGKKSCNLTTISCTSFFPSKPLGCYGDGGACFTNDDKIAEKIKVLRTHGQARRYYHTDIGMNARLDTLQAAILLAKMEIFDDEIQLRHKVAARYNKLLEGIAPIQRILPENTSAYAQYTIEVDNRDSFIEKMKTLGVPTAVHYPIPLHLQPVYAGQYQKGSYPKSELAASRVVSLPMHPYLDEASQDEVVKAVKVALQI